MSTTTRQITGTPKDARVSSLAPLLKRADKDQRAAWAGLVADSLGLQVLVETASEASASSSDDEDSPRIEFPDFHDSPLQFEDMYGNRYDNYYDYIQAATNGEFGRISGLDRDNFSP